MPLTLHSPATASVQWMMMGCWSCAAAAAAVVSVPQFKVIFYRCPFLPKKAVVHERTFQL